MENYWSLFVFLIIVTSRSLFTWRIVRGEDRRTLMDLDNVKPRMYSLGISLALLVGLGFLVFYAGNEPYFLGLALGIFALFGLSHALLEKKYLPHTRRHVATLLSVSVGVVAIPVFYLLFSQMA
ncbi:hypothetical protein [Saccharibacillus kuerlensis]|uniref:DUF4181 domain-containing protein n=1 Tax=Saccharibacillus kuerlensis TaxID=459527 RepID=A0ABQ2L2E6_9BACL|nr:hypothetical protein [Saccharibacillus kuerlensis]GGN98503.1 hypothetical protein GCM10010969_17710 [Saccharibacillus kuerlensis]